MSTKPYSPAIPKPANVEPARAAVRLARVVRAEAALALAAALLTAILLAIGFAFAWPLRVDLGGGARDGRFATELYEPEQFGADLARWTGAAATIAFPQLPSNSGATLELRLLHGRPPGQPDAHVTLSAAGQPLGAFDVTHSPLGARVYRAVVPVRQQLDWATRVELDSTTFTSPGDPRVLGVVVDQITVVPTNDGWLLPSLWLLLWSAAWAAPSRGSRSAVSPRCWPGAWRAARWRYCRSSTASRRCWGSGSRGCGWRES